MTKLIANLVILTAGSIFIIGGLVAVFVMFLGAGAIVLVRRAIPHRTLAKS